MCAAQAAQRGRRVLIIDHAPKIGERIRISGGGKCNFTNRQVGQSYLSQNPHFCRSALTRFSQHDFLAMIEARGIAWHEREHGQLFCNESAQDIIDMLRDACTDAGVEWAFPCKVHGCEARNRRTPLCAADRARHHALPIVGRGDRRIGDRNSVPRSLATNWLNNLACP